MENQHLQTNKSEHTLIRQIVGQVTSDDLLYNELFKELQEKVMDTMKARFGLPEAIEALAQHSDWDSKIVADLAKLLLESLHTCFCNAIRIITKCGYSNEVAENMVLRCGPFYSRKDMMTSIVDRALNFLANEGCHDATLYTFKDLTLLVDYMVVDMVTMLRKVKPSLSVCEAMWSLLICDLNILDALEETAGPKAIKEEGTSATPETETSSQNIETISLNGMKVLPLKLVESIEGTFQCSKKKSSRTKRDTLQQNVIYYEKTYIKGRWSKGGLRAKLAARGDLSLDKKQSPSSSLSENKKNLTLPLKDAKEKPNVAPTPETVPPKSPKTADYYLAGKPTDESSGEHVPQDEKDKMILAAVGQLQSLQKELQSLDDWVNVKVTQVVKRLSQCQPELNKLKAEKEAAEKLKEDEMVLEDSTTKKLEEMRSAVETTKSQLQKASSTIVKLRCEKSVIKQEKEEAENQSLLQAKRLEEAICKERAALKKSESFGSEKNFLEEDVKSLKRSVGSKQKDLEKAKGLLKETETRLAKKERDTVKFVEQALSIRDERERLEALANEEDEMATKEAEKEFKKCEKEIKTIRYQVAAMKLEAETKSIAAIQKCLSLQPFEGTSRSEASRKDFKHLECVMCLSKEKTVVFVPCGHQVLCGECNVIHKKKGMKECPSCRTPIQKRVTARFNLKE